MHKVRCRRSPSTDRGKRPGGYDSGIDTSRPVHHYLLLLETDLNRVFSRSLGSVAVAELEGVTRALLAAEHRPTDVTVTSLGRATGLSFSSSADPDALDRLLGQLSCGLALFEQTPGDSTTLTPRPLTESLVYDTDLVSVQRYRGKTNERLTRAMLNLALANAGIGLTGPWDRTPTVLDPMCGRGTTLNWALCYGLNAVGIEPDAGSLRHYDGFLRTWAKQHRLPHKHQGYRPNNAEQRHTTLDVAPTRAAQKAGDGQRVETFNADGGDRSLAIKRGSIDAIVADLPYGIQHRADQARLDPADTLELLARVAPTWRRWLRKGGSVCVAWNVKRASRVDVAVALAEAGLLERVPDHDLAHGPDHGMEHVVDSTITRDVLVAVAR
ncbi:MAG: SAM-dependent methyltransferase [Acidimicrobiia bacterium]|nr:SAM-dependent methyltransferase [Acidimicrobiia bacterium]